MDVKANPSQPQGTSRKRTTIFLLAVVIASPFADEKNKLERNRGAQRSIVARMFRGIEFTEEQKSKIKEIEAEYGPTNLPPPPRPSHHGGVSPCTNQSLHISARHRNQACGCGIRISTGLRMHDFTEKITAHQQRLYRYIMSLLGESEAAWDVLQETNRVVLEKRDEFEAGTNFLNWALTVAQFQTMAWLRDKSRDRHVVTPEIVELMSDDAKVIDDGDDERRDALKACLESLSDQHRQFVHSRYVRSEKLSEISQRTGRTVNSLKQLFFRIRGTLADCVEQRLEMT